MLNAILKRIAHGRLVDLYGCGEWDAIADYLENILIDRRDFNDDEQLLRVVVENYNKLVIV